MNGTPLSNPVIWRRPTGPVLRGEVFSRDTPPFDPFPDVTQVTKGYCPVAILHDLFWGRTYLGRRDSWVQGQRLGELYHDLMGSFRIDVANRRVATDQLRDRQIADGMAQRYFQNFAERYGVPPANADELRSIFRRYVARKWSEGELQRLPGQFILTEVDVANPRSEFHIGGITRHYPLRGRIDELNITQRLLIERTLDVAPLSSDPPQYKFWQAWLYAQAITTLEDFRRPASLSQLWGGPLQVTIETPDRDYHVTADDSFMRIVAQAYYWIRAVFHGVNQTAVYNESACTMENPDESCTHCRVDCFTIPVGYPSRRDELRRLCRGFSRAFLYERVWDYDLWFYRQCLLPHQFLEQDGQRVTGAVLEVTDDRLRVEVNRDGAKAVRANRDLLGIPAATGNFFLSRQVRLHLTRAERTANRDAVSLEFRISRRDSIQLRDAASIELFTPPSNGIFLSAQPPGFLKDMDRQRLGRLLKVGAQSLTAAQQSGVVRALRTVTGEIETNA
jgi:hypothetical protein